MDIDATKTRQVNHDFRQDLSVSRDENQIRLVCLEMRHGLIVPTQGLLDWQVGLFLRQEFDCRGLKLLLASDRFVGLRVDRDHLRPLF